MARTPARSSTRNPLAIDPDREQRVRERAYHLWEADGKPHGRDVEYWERARELIGKEESADGDPDPKSTPVARRETKVEEPAPQENTDESPDPLPDQGEVKTTSAPKRRSRAKPKKPA
jgi:Protein of unknown function (DUF2934)